ncbi:hypothetical protein FCE95_07425 [Luteimonas gilva]|uniref:SGNH hydrolase-type esterase domain-containing protein n=2 Tax=Luteimonas gilva TaxID=2572684 RepID=A0A4U5K0I1_9GAMM|nr:hypothetical protein FCE95_07425 [Luteimonas gilva]
MRLSDARLFFLSAIAVVTVAAGCAGVPAAPAPVSPPVDPPSSPEWTQDMARFDAEDAAHAPPARPIVFTGSSSVRLWASLGADFPGRPVLNRGFGGSQLRDVVHYADQVAIRYRPRMIVVYAGDNDIDAKRTPQQVHSDFVALIARLRKDLPDTPIAYLSIKPSPLRVAQLPAQREANALIRAEANKWRRVEFIDVTAPMLDASGQPRGELFMADRLHMNAEGYAVWRKVVAPYLK